MIFEVSVFRGMEQPYVIPDNAHPPYRRDCLISYPHEEYRYFLKNSDIYSKLNPYYFKLLFPLRVPINGVQLYQYFLTKVAITWMSWLQGSFGSFLSIYIIKSW